MVNDNSFWGWIDQIILKLEERKAKFYIEWNGSSKVLKSNEKEFSKGKVFGVSQRFMEVFDCNSILE